MRFLSVTIRKTTGREHRRLAPCALLLLVWISSCSPTLQVNHGPAQTVSKKVSFAILEDYDKGEDLNEIAKDFQLMRELEIDTLRCSFGWDDFEPVRGQYDFVWLKEFVKLAEQHGIKLRPYIGYTPRWAGTAGSADNADWNNPPADYQAWHDFVYNLVSALREFPNVLSYEIYNEQKKFGITERFEKLFQSLYFDTAGTGAWLPAMAAALNTTTADRIMFGSDYPLECKSAANIIESLDMIRQAPCATADKTAILGKTAAGLFNLKIS